MTTLDRGAILIGVLFTTAGVAFLLEALDVFTIDAKILWPILVIGFGVGIAFGGRPRNGEQPRDDGTTESIYRGP